jgi:uncharacterized membrane protein
VSVKLKLLIFVAIAFWLSGIFVEFIIPLFPPLAFVYPFLHGIYSNVCHQQSSKLIEYADYHTLVCARCTGIYLGGFISSFALLFVKSIKITDSKIILLAALPMLIDVLLYSSGLYAYSKTIAFITGILFGSVGIVYIYLGLQNFLDKNAE